MSLLVAAPIGSARKPAADRTTGGKTFRWAAENGGGHPRASASPENLGDRDRP